MLAAAATITVVLCGTLLPASAEMSAKCRLPINERMIAGCTEIIDDAATAPAERAEAMSYRGAAQMSRGNLERALTDFSAFIAMSPDSAHGYYLRATAHERQDNHELALADYDKSIALNPNYPFAYAARGAIYAAKGDFDRALKNHDEAIRLKPELAALYNNRGLVRRNSGDMKGAIADFSTAIRLDPKNTLALAFRGNAYLSRNESGHALADFEAALRLSTTNQDMAYYGRAEIKLERGDNDGAIADYSKALEFAPDMVDAYINRGVAFVRKGDYAASIPNYDAALKLTPNDPAIRNRRSHANFITGHFAEAAEDFGDVVEKSPEYGLAKLLRYIARARSGDYDLGELKRNTETLDRTGWPWPMVAVYLGQMTRDEMLAKMKNMRLEDDFGPCGVSFYLGQYLMVKRKPQEALPYLKQAAEVCRGDGEFERDAARNELKRQQASN